MAKKFYPGHYIGLGVDAFDIRPAIQRELAADHWRGVFTYLTWGLVEPEKGVYRFDDVRALLDALPAGKKLGVSLAWQNWSGAGSPVPADMLKGSQYDGGYRIRVAEGKKAGVGFACVHMPAVMDRYLAFVRAFARAFDGDDRLAFVTSAEIPYETSLRVGQYDQAVGLQNMMRLAQAFPRSFGATPTMSLGAWWSWGTAAQGRQYLASWQMQGGGAAFPDLRVEGVEFYRPQVMALGSTMPVAMGVEWDDYVDLEAVGTEFPRSQLHTAEQYSADFIWWLFADRAEVGGHSFAEASRWLALGDGLRLQRKRKPLR